MPATNNVKKIYPSEAYLPSQTFRQENTISQIQLGLLSPEQRVKQLLRTLPNGSVIGLVTNSQTLNYKTLKPERGGLFCERTFGPIQSYVCACGKRQKGSSMKYCPDCEVEYTSSRVRRYRLGFIRLGVPIAHIWYLKGRPSYISLLLNMEKKHAESLVYGTTCIFNNYNFSFGKRIQKLRLQYNENFSKLRRDAYHRSFIVDGKRRPSGGLGLQDMQTIVYHKGDDFWVHPTCIYHCANHSFWEKKDFLRKKPFYQIPMIRDCFNFPYRGCLNNLYDLEDYFFTFKRMYGSTPIPKYTKAIQNSMICHASSRDIELVLSGGIAFMHLFSKLDSHRLKLSLFRMLSSSQKQIKELVEKKRRQKLTRKEKKLLKACLICKSKSARRLKFFRAFWQTGARPEWMFITILPILPPDLRPIIKMSNDQLAISDLNRLYQYVFHRNRNLKLTIANIYDHLGVDLFEFDDPIDLNYNYQSFRFSTNVISFQQKLLQEAVDALLENGKGGSKPICGTNNRPLKSLSDILKGKKGRFRQNLLGKRVDYSGRSVIVVGPTLKLHQCGLPKEIAVELFQSLLIRKLLLLKLAKTIVGAKHLIQHEHPIIWSLLTELMNSYPIFLNRAPTLHRLGIQAFLPKLVRGKAILLHPLVCPAFNADFDGDQMGVHIPLSIEAKSEAWSLMLATQNILSPATGDPILTPSQDMVLGCYYFTTVNLRREQSRTNYFSSLEDVYKAYLTKRLHPHDFIWLKWYGTFYSTQETSNLVEVRLRRFQCLFQETTRIALNVTQTIHLELMNQPQNTRFSFKQNGKDQYIRTTVGRVVLNLEFCEQIHNTRTKYFGYSVP
uniref:RNA polymerase beta subunit n=1 Tax=Tetraselmis marina TaxID=41888 RepID=UPI0021ACC7A3|nr:RNA polymerase beta subunit [Tetraselmis marina]UUA64517.1 RNA polymerase beta subunit [Tetraselmis marina]